MISCIPYIYTHDICIPCSIYFRMAVDSKTLSTHLAHSRLHQPWVLVWFGACNDVFLGADMNVYMAVGRDVHYGSHLCLTWGSTCE